MDDAVDAPACPKCGGHMTRRESTKSGRPFWGCDKFWIDGPDHCDGLIDIQEVGVVERVEVETERRVVDYDHERARDRRFEAALAYSLTLVETVGVTNSDFNGLRVDSRVTRLGIELADELMKGLNE